MKKKKLITAILIIVLLIIIFVMFSKKPIAVEVAKVKTGAIQDFIEEEGKTRLEEKYIISMPIDGKIHRIKLEEGDIAKKDEVIATVDDFPIKQKIDSFNNKIKELNASIEGVDKAKPKQDEIKATEVNLSEAKLKIESAEKELNIVKINLQTKEKDYERMKQLLDDQVINQAEFDPVNESYKSLKEQIKKAELGTEEAKLNYEIAQLKYNIIIQSTEDNEYQRKVFQSQIKQIEAELNILKDNLDKTKIKSPVNGIIFEKFIESEQVIPAGTSLLIIGNLDTIEIESDILSEEIGKVKVGQKVEITGKALEDKTITGEVKRIYPTGFKKISSLGVEQQRVKTIITYNNKEIGLRPQTTVDVRIIVNEVNPALIIPERALFKSDNQWNVFKVENSIAKLTPIKIGIRNDEYAQVLEGLKEGEIIISDLVNELKDGSKVKIKE